MLLYINFKRCDCLKVSVIGSGVVGTIMGNGLVQIGNDVTFYDINDKRLDELRSEGFKATNDIVDAVKSTDISFLCVPTPSTADGIDLSYIKSAATEISKIIKEKDSYHLVVVKSTVTPGTTENFVRGILEEVSGKKCGESFGLCMNPEFLTEIHNSWSDDPSNERNFFTEDRIVIGEFDKKAGDILESLYRPVGIPIFRTDLKTAEMTKYACNCALASRVSYWNEIFYICQKLGIDSDAIAKIAAMDKRIGKYGTVHGMAFGGKCFPKDLRALIAFSEKGGHNPDLLKSVENVNERIKKDRGVRE
jgi:UDPglucose 6-dehydrogenase